MDVFVSKDQLERGLEFLNTLYKALESRGHRVDLASTRGHIRSLELDVRETAKRDYHWFRDWSPDRPTLGYVGSIAFGLTLFELTEEVEARYLNGKYVRLSDLPPRRGGYPSSSWTTTHEFATGRLSLRASSPYWRAPWERPWRKSKPFVNRSPRRRSPSSRRVPVRTITGGLRTWREGSRISGSSEADPSVGRA